MSAFSWCKRCGSGVVLMAGCALSAVGQSSVAITEPTALLPQAFGQWTATPAGGGPVGSVTLSGISQTALEECGPVRSAVADYERGGRRMHVEAIQFGDRSGAYSAFTLIARPGMRAGDEPGMGSAVGAGAVLFSQGATVVLANFGGEVSAADAAGLKPLAELLPKVGGSKGVPPMLPTLLPARGLVPGSVRYALGPASYQAEGGVLPAQGLGWDKSAEAVTALYADKRGRETVTILVYPTPMIAGSFAKQVQAQLGGLGPAMSAAQVRREGELVMLANGSFAADEATRMLENIHLREQLSFDKDVQPVFHVEVAKTYSLLTNITILAGVGMLAAVLLGLFLGGGRAAFRVMRGKPAATELEFLSLHLDTQNSAAKFLPQETDTTVKTER